MMYREYLENQESQFIKLLTDVVNLESPSDKKHLNDKLADYLEDLFKDIADVKRIKKDVCGDNLRITLGEGEKQILILCHMDTVWDEGEILKRPVTIEGDKIKGPGIYDMKFGIIQAYYALKAIKQFDLPLTKKIVLYINSDEEIGSTYSEENIKEEALKSECVLVLEPSEESGFVKTQRKGMSTYKIGVHGKSAHAGAFHQDGISAVKELALKITEIENMTDYNSGITANVGIIRGGNRINVIPDYAEAELEFRYITEEQADFVDAYMKNLKSSTKGATLEVTKTSFKYPIEKNEGNTALFRLVARVQERLNIPVGEILAGGLSDGNTTSCLGIPTIDGMGAVGSHSHSIDEYISKEKIVERTIMLVEVLRELEK